MARAVGGAAGGCRQAVTWWGLALGLGTHAGLYISVCLLHCVRACCCRFVCVCVCLRRCAASTVVPYNGTVTCKPPQAAAAIPAGHEKQHVLDQQYSAGQRLQRLLPQTTFCSSYPPSAASSSSPAAGLPGSGSSRDGRNCTAASDMCQESASTSVAWTRKRAQLANSRRCARRGLRAQEGAGVRRAGA